jgi:general secretion pathway protein G
MKKKGFTLVELLVVIAIIGILAAIGITALSTARVKARDAKRIADLKQIQAALELYFNEKGNYPTGSSLKLGDITGNTDCNNGKCTVLCVAETNSGFRSDTTGCTGTPQMSLVPKDPSAPDNASACTGTSTTLCHYAYTAQPSGCDNSATACTGYQIWAYLEGASGGFSAGPLCASQNGMKSATCP